MAAMMQYATPYATALWGRGEPRIREWDQKMERLIARQGIDLVRQFRPDAADQFQTRRPQSLCSTMAANHAHMLTRHAARTLTLPTLPPHQTELVRTILREVRDLDRDVSALLAPYGGAFDPSADAATACALLVNHLAMRRNKRCLLAYHRVRAERLERACWEGVDVAEALGGRRDGTGAVESGSEGAGALCPEEEEYVRLYSELLAQYKGQWTDVDLTGSLEPPKDLFVDVRVLKDAGEVQTEYGSINLTKNSQFFVRQGDVERLVAQGYLQRLD